MQGVTPAIRVGAPRGLPCSLSLFTQPLNPTVTYREQTGQGSGPRAAERGEEWVGSEGWGKMVLTGSLELWLLAGRPPTKRVWGWGCSAPWCCRRGPSWLQARAPSVTSRIRFFSQRTETWGQEAGQGRAARPCPPSFFLARTLCQWPGRERWRLWARSRVPRPSICATKCPLLRKSAREGLLGLRLAAKSRRPRGLLGRTCMERLGLEAELASACAAPLSPPQLCLALPVPMWGQDAHKLQVTGQGTPKLVGVSGGPEVWGQHAGGVLGGLTTAAGSLGAWMVNAGAARTGATLPVTPALPAHPWGAHLPGGGLQSSRPQVQGLGLQAGCTARAHVHAAQVLLQVEYALWAQEPVQGGQAVSSCRRPAGALPPSAHQAHRRTKTLLMQPLK